MAAMTFDSLSVGSRHVDGPLIYHLGYLVQIGIDLVRQLIEVTPFLAELRQLMSRSQEVAILPLDGTVKLLARVRGRAN